MKKLILAILFALPLATLCQAQTLPYTAAYSSNFKIADPSYAAKVLTLWKDFESNTLDKHTDMFADTVTMLLAEGAPVKGKAENLAGAKAYRSSLKSYKVTVEAWTSLKSVDRNEISVGIWGVEEVTDKDGKQSTHRIHEVWGFNKDGKISLMMQYVGM